MEEHKAELQKLRSEVKIRPDLSQPEVLLKILTNQVLVYINCKEFQRSVKVVEWVLSLGRSYVVAVVRFCGTHSVKA